jgi:ankyrin repeat protein
MLRTNSPDSFDAIVDIELPEGVDELIFGDNNNHSLIAIEQTGSVNQPVSAQPLLITLAAISAPAVPPLNLHQAVVSGDADSVAHCISHPDAQINERDRLGYTPIHLAVREQHTSIVLMLLNAGADPSIPNANNKPLFSVRFKKDRKFALQLWGMRNQIINPDHRQSMLNSCFEVLMLEFLKKLTFYLNDMQELLRSVTLEEAQKHLKKKLGFRTNTPLILVCNQSQEYFELAETIIDLSSTDSLTLANTQGETALFFAQVKNHQRIISYLTQRLNSHQPMPEQTQPAVISEPEPEAAPAPAPMPPEPSEEEIDPFLQLKDQQKELMQQLEDKQSIFKDCLEWMAKLKKMAEDVIAQEDDIRKNLQNVNKQIADHEKRADSLSTSYCDEELHVSGTSTVTHQYSKLTGHKRRIEFIDNDDELEDEGLQPRSALPQ